MILLYYTLFYKFLTNLKLVYKNYFITANTKLAILALFVQNARPRNQNNIR